MRDIRHWQAVQVAYRAWRSSYSPTDETVLRQLISDEFTKAGLSGPHSVCLKALRWPALCDILQQLANRDEYKHLRGKLLELVDWTEAGDIQTFALERFVRAYSVSHEMPPPNCRVTALWPAIS